VNCIDSIYACYIILSRSKCNVLHICRSCRTWIEQLASGGALFYWTHKFGNRSVQWRLGPRDFIARSLHFQFNKLAFRARLDKNHWYFRWTPLTVFVDSLLVFSISHRPFPYSAISQINVPQPFNVPLLVNVRVG